MPSQVLLVDDEPALLNILSFFLEDSGYQVRVAQDGSAAMRELQSHQPDAIVCDLHMPGMNGLEFCQEVRRNPKWRSIYFVLLTGTSEGPCLQKQSRLGIDRFLPKPFELDDLLAILENGHRPQEMS